MKKTRRHILLASGVAVLCFIGVLSAFISAGQKTRLEPAGKSLRGAKSLDRAVSIKHQRSARDDTSMGIAHHLAKEANHTSATRASEVLIDEEALIRRAYSSRTAKELKAVLFLLGDTHPDAFALRHATKDLCRYSNPKFLKRHKANLSKHVPKVEYFMSSIEYVSEFAAVFCDGAGLDAQGYYTWLNKAYDATKDPGVKRLLDVALSQTGERTIPLKQRLKLRDDLEEIVYTTTSPYVFKEAGMRLVSGRYGHWDVGQSIEAKSTQHLEWVNERVVKRVGVMLAFCQISNGCAPKSLQTILMCAPIYCEPGMTMVDLFNNRYSKYTMILARGVAKEIMSRRRTG